MGMAISFEVSERILKNAVVDEMDGSISLSRKKEVWIGYDTVQNIAYMGCSRTTGTLAKVVDSIPSWTRFVVEGEDYIKLPFGLSYHFGTKAIVFKSDLWDYTFKVLR